MMTKETATKLRDEIGQSLRPGVMRTVTAAAVVAGFLGGAVVTDGTSISVADNAAFARGGNGGGHGGGRGGRGGGKGGHGQRTDAGNGLGHAKGHGHNQAEGHAHLDGDDHRRGHGHGHARGDDDSNGRSGPPGAPSLENGASENGITAAALGSLNAAHASSTARENAAPNSMVGHIAAFADAVESDNVNAAAEALAAGANKSITPEVVTEVARLADVEVSDETASAIAAAAADIQAGDDGETSDQSMPGGS